MTNAPNDNRNVHGTSTVRPAGAGGAPAGKRGMPWWAWLLTLALLIAVLLLAMRSCSERDDTLATTTEPASAASTSETTTTVEAMPGAAADQPLAVSRVTLPGGRAVDLAPSTLNYELQRYLASTAPAPRTFTFENLNFATSSAALPAEAQQTVSTLAQILQAYPNATVRVQGYADARGGETANAALGAQRAEAVARALIAQGVPADRVTGASGGESNPVASNATTQGQAENRRTELVVTAK